MSLSGQYQYAAQNGAASTQLSLSNNSGISWQTLTSASNGLPSGSVAYQSTPSGNPAYTSLSQSATSQYALLAASGGQLYVSNNANSTTPVFTAANIGGQPFIYLPFENSAVDMLGNSALTLTGPPTYTTGKIGSYAMNFANTAGGTAAQYLRGTWAGASNFTVSFWFNTPSSGVQQNMFSAYGNSGFVVYITTGNQLRLYVNNTDAVLGPNVTTNTWYNVVAIFQANGTGSFYVNNILYGTYACGATPGTSSGLFALGTMESLTVLAFNGYIDDFRIYNFAAPNVVAPTIYAPFENSYTDAMSFSTMTGQGSPTFVTGIVGNYAVNLVNTVGTTATKYIKEGWPGSTNFTISFWFNAQTLGTQQVIVGAYSGQFQLLLFANNQLGFYVPISGGNTIITYTPGITSNTWYQWTAIFRQSGLCSMYLNGALVGTYNNSTAFSGTSSGFFTIGCVDNTAAQAFNGYVDDFMLYNSAITYSPIVPMNWAYTAVSGSGQYMLAAAAGGGLFQSSNYGVTWSQITSPISNPLYAGLSMSYSGQYMLAVGSNVITPQKTSLAASSWSQSGISWTTSASSQYSTFAPYQAFNNTSGSTWASNSGTYNGSGTWTGSAAATTIQGIGSISGEWVQLQSNIALCMQSYTFTCGGPTNQTPKTYYIIGSNDNSTWYPIQYVSMGSNPYTTNYSTASNYIIVNQSGSQNLVVGASTAVLTCTTYSTTINSYAYFRILITTTFNGGVAEIGEWYINFANGQNYSTNYGTTWSGLSLNGTTQSFSATSGNGQYTLTGTGQTAYLVSNYLGGVGTNTYTTLTLSGINANINCASISATGQYMVVMTQGTTNNVYYSTNYGSTFTALTVGSAAMTSCAISADGFYITVSNATTVYTLNRNTQGFAVSVGNTTGVVNQGQNAIAIGNQAGVTNQSVNSIVLNSSGSTLDTYNSGFYVSNISDYGTSYASSFSLLAYGSDSQIVKGAITVLSSGYVGIGTATPTNPLQVAGRSLFGYIPNSKTGMFIDNETSYGTTPCIQGVSSAFGTNPISINPAGGYVGISKTVPTSTLDISGTLSINNGVAATTAGQYQGIQMSYVGTGSTGYANILATNPGATYNTLGLNVYGGYVGIGTTAPIATLHVYGTNSTTGGQITPLALTNSNQPTLRWDVGPNVNSDFCVYSSSGGVLYIARSNVSAGWAYASDLRLKDDIVSIPNCIDTIQALRPVSYRMKSNMDSQYKTFGLIAQEVMEVLPELVTSVYDANHEHIYGITYNGFIPILIGAIKELSTSHATLQAENAQLKSQVNSLLASYASLLAWAQSQGFTA
jgi:hypothetical protein